MFHTEGYKKDSLHNANCLLNVESGAAGNRTLVRSKHLKAFYMLSHHIYFFELRGGWATHPDRSLISLEFAVSQSTLTTSLIRDDTPHDRNQTICEIPKDVC